VVKVATGKPSGRESVQGVNPVSSTENNRSGRRHPKSMSPDVELLPWAAEQLRISKATAYRLARAGKMPGTFKVGNQYRISVPAFWRSVHGDGATT
jgi:excisionase family DNA binding protein